MQEFQRLKLSRLLSHARKTVPFYQTRLNAIFNDDGTINWDNWHKLPILKRSDLQDSFDEMQTTALPLGLGRVAQFSSSGSSGAPITISVNGRASAMSTATIHRGHGWHDIDWTKNLLAWMGDSEGADLENGKTYGKWGPKWHWAAHKGTYLEYSRLASDDLVLDFIKRKNISYLTGRPKSMQQLALKAIKRGDHIPLLGILPFSTSIEENEREDCREAFGCEMVEIYSAKEGYAMAYQCPDNAHLHINAEIIKLEILDDDDNPCAVGQVGRVIITPLYSMAQPLIRYEIGDLASFGPPCSCGRTLPVLEKVAGRVSNLFRFPDGTVIAPSIAWGEHRHLLNSNSWQFAQTGPLHIEVRYVPKDPDIPAQEAALADVVRKNMHKDLSVTFKRLDIIPTRHGGKHMTFVCELSEAELEALGG